MSYQPATLTTRGDLLDAGASGIWQRLALGTTNYVLTSNGTDAVWGVAPANAGGALSQIASTVLTGTAASITFSSIPGSYSGLALDWIARDTSVATAQSLFMQINGDTAANYDYEFCEFVATSTPAPSQNLAQTSMLVGTSVSANGASGLFGAGHIEIPWYASTTAQKTVNQHHGWKSGTSSGTIHRVQGSGWWRSASAITDLKLFPGSGSFVAGTAMVLYGLS